MAKVFDFPIILHSQTCYCRCNYPFPYSKNPLIFTPTAEPRLKPNFPKLKSSYSYDNNNLKEKSSTSRGFHYHSLRKRVFFLDVNPLCYNEGTWSFQYFAHWISLFLADVSNGQPVVAVIDGERGNEYRRNLLPTYKANRKRPGGSVSGSLIRTSVERSHKVILDVLKNCNLPVVKIESHEADDVVATLVAQVLQKGFQSVIASPDKDFKQLISEDVQILIPMPELDRWSFYTLKHYKAQYNCDPQSDLSLRSMLGDEADGVPGIQDVVPKFGRKTALKLLRKHGNLENLLAAATVRTVGRPYVQDTLTKHADYLRRNYQILSLKTDVDVQFDDNWLSDRDTSNDSVTISNLIDDLKANGKFYVAKQPPMRL
ncbi:unnamed protein product [Cuscuta europaea]|uniref:5'-3' exonuclease domain-containing protein n=1 Tax=Cuscuta europaea TaxID=41803 RepID=A0A9P0Z6I2_CUSEU|nr:unnamed protein product [Cuscuta europaea]